MTRRISKLSFVLIAVALLLAMLPMSALALEAGNYSYEVNNGQATITGYHGSATALTIPSTLGGHPVTAIGKEAFFYHTSLTSVTIPSGVTSIGASAFISCENLTNIMIPNTVLTIGETAFTFCDSLTSVAIPSSVLSIGARAFAFCDRLAAIQVSEFNTKYSSQDGVLFNKAKTELIQYPTSNTRKTYAIPSGVIEIGRSAFSSGANLTSITIPNSVAAIWGYAFTDCVGLTSVTIPPSVNYIEYQAFSGCSNLICAFFRGNAPGLSFNVFSGCKTGFTVYYLTGKTGFTNPWHGYPTATYILPAAPAVKAVLASQTSAKLTWGAVAGAAKYEVYRATSINGTYTKLAETASATYINIGLATGTVYYYKVRAYGLVGTVKIVGDFSAAVSPFKPAAPMGVKATSAFYNSVRLTWGAVTGASGYVVYRSASSNGAYTLVAVTSSGSTAGYTNAGLITGTTYYYKLRAYRTVGATKVYGDYSAIVSARPIPALPTGVKAVRASATSIKLTWGAVTGASGYVVYRATSSTGPYSLAAVLTGGTKTTYTSAGLTTGKTYYYKLRAYRTVGAVKVYSDYSATVSAKP